MVPEATSIPLLYRSPEFLNKTLNNTTENGTIKVQSNLISHQPRIIVISIYINGKLVTSLKNVPRYRYAEMIRHIQIRCIVKIYTITNPITNFKYVRAHSKTVLFLEVLVENTGDIQRAILIFVIPRIIYICQFPPVCPYYDFISSYPPS